MLKILVADDHAVVRKGLVQILTDGSDAFCVDEAESGEEALDKVRKSSYDLVLLDISMPGKGGLEVLRELKHLAPQLPVLILSMHAEEQYAVRALRTGASGYLTKGSAPDELACAIRKVLAGGRYISGVLAEKIAFGLLAGTSLHETLSGREYEVLCMIASGKTLSSIAGELALSVKTIGTFRTRILKKMKMENNAELTRYAIMNKLVG
jgi:two-component system invasion response regulator UvrY